jgi:hypothetical protein
MAAFDSRDCWDDDDAFDVPVAKSVERASLMPDGAVRKEDPPEAPLGRMVGAERED